MDTEAAKEATAKRRDAARTEYAKAIHSSGLEERQEYGRTI